MPTTSSLLIIALACGALLIRVGLGWYSTGMVRAKSAGGAAVRNVTDLAVAVLAFWAIGAAVMNYGGRMPLGLDAGLIFDARGGENWLTFPQLVLVLIATAPVAGAVAERCKFLPLLAVPALLAAVVVPVAAHWAWGEHGWLHRMNFFDAAGASVLHVTGGACALAGAWVVGPRSGKYNRDGSANLIPGHSVPMASVGVMLMLAGWVPYVLFAAMLHGGFTSKTPGNVLLSGCAGALMSAVLSHVRYGKPDIMLTYSGLLGGLVAITGGAGVENGISAVITGVVAGVIVPTATVMLDLILHVDDPAGGVAIHLLGGAWGTLAVGIFAPAESYLGKLSQFCVQALGLVAIAALSLALSAGLFLLLRATVGLRISEEAEYDGTDLAEHDLNAYPDFQQTMIKSYHLREA